MKKSALLLFATALLTMSCQKGDRVTANFETNVIDQFFQAKVELNNLSENATSYSWSAPNGSPEESTDENPVIIYTESGVHSITLEAIDGNKSDFKTIEVNIDSLHEHIPYRYLENDGISVYYETTNQSVYESLIPDGFDMPDQMLVHAFFLDFYDLDYGGIPYKENGIYILTEYQGEEVWHCVYMPVTDEHSMWSGIIGLGLPKTMGQITLNRTDSVYHGTGTNQLGGTMNMAVDTAGYTLTASVKQELIDLASLRTLQVRNGKIIQIGRSGSQMTLHEVADLYPNLLRIDYGYGTVTTNTSTINFNHPLDLTPSNIIGAYYLHNKIPFGLTGSPI